MDSKEYYAQFMQDIYARSGALGDSNIPVFTERMCEFLVEQGVIENFRPIGYKKTSQGIRVDAGDCDEETEVVSLFVTDFRFGNELETISQSDVTKQFQRAEKFFTSSLAPRFHQKMEESASGYQFAREIHETNASSKISKVRFYLLTNAELSNRFTGIDGRKENGFQYVFDIWDMGRLFRLDSSGGHEDVVVDLGAEGGIPCLAAFNGADDCESYLLIMPGDRLADLYDRYGERLLEQNVRTFLQFRGKINKGIRNTILHEPQMFFSYNNGLCVTAEKVVTNENRDRILSVTNLQIVNGGQTTASLYTTRKNRANLSKVYVQVKLSLVSPDQVETVVPKISEYANTQNKVSAADFMSNHPFHLRIEELSRRLWAPSPQGGRKETHWFYERVRGQYANAQARLTPAKQKEFLFNFPKHQMFTKTDLAKFEYSLDMKPHIVSRGAQKNFAQFAQETVKKWIQQETQFNELYFKNLIAKAILFRFLDNCVREQEWYGDFKAQIVTYSLAKLASMVSDAGKYLNLERVWREQGPSPATKAQLLAIAESVNRAIQNTPAENANVTEWCKNPLCWIEVRSLPLTLSKEVSSELMRPDDLSALQKDAMATQKVDSGIDKQEYVVKKGKAYWQLIQQFAADVPFLSPKETDILKIACSDKLPSDKQSAILVDIERKAVEEGFYPADSHNSDRSASS